MSLQEVEIEIDKDVYLKAYQHILEPNDIDIELIWGGRDSGKSHFLAQLTTEECLSLDYYRCILVKETHEAIKDSQVAMIEEIVEDWEMEQLFKFIKSPLEIRCLNKNRFIARGTDKPKKLRSITNPSHVWMEEANQLKEIAFITILTSLRNKYGRVKLYLSFNPEADTPDFVDHWLYKMFFAKHYPKHLSYTSELIIDIPGAESVKLKYRSTHTTYRDNPYVSAQRIAFHEALKTMNYHWYQVFTVGLWGNMENDMPWLFAYSRQKHVSSKELFANRAYTLYLSWDFNRNPMVCTVIQWYDETVWIIDVIKAPNIGTEGMCELVLMRYPGFLYVITGDYNGMTVSTLHKEHVTNYSIIKSMLKLSEGQVKVMPNPRLEKNQTLVNTIFYNYNVQICPKKAQPAIYDAENVKKRADGTIVKDDRNDPAQQADVLDTIRYWFNKFMGYFIKQMQTHQEKKKIAVTHAAMPKTDLAAITAIEHGQPVICTKNQYHESVRNAILTQAGKWIDGGDVVRGTLALEEIKRLDSLFNKS